MMKKFMIPFITLILMTVCSFQAFSQSAAITREVEIIKKKAAGLTLLDEGGFLTNSKDLISFDKEYWPVGYEYLIVAVADCYDLCNISMKFVDFDRDQLQILSPNITINGTLIGGRFKFEKTKNTNGKFYVHSDSDYNDYYVYALLFSRKLY